MAFRKTAVALAVGLLVFTSFFAIFGQESNGEEIATESIGAGEKTSQEGYTYVNFPYFVQGIIVKKLVNDYEIPSETAEYLAGELVGSFVLPLAYDIVEYPNEYIPKKYSRCIPYIKDIDLVNFAVITGYTETLGATLDIPGELTPTDSNKKVIVYGIRDEAFKEKLDSVEKVTMADSIMYIGAGAFRDNTDLKEIVISKNALVLRDNCFSSTRIEKLVIPESVMFLDSVFIRYCFSLERITFEGFAPEVVADKAFRMNREGQPGTVFVESPGNWFEGYASSHEDIFGEGGIPDYFEFMGNESANEELSQSVAIGIIIIFIIASGALIFVVKK